MAQSVKHLTHDLSSGLDLIVCEFEPHMGLSVAVSTGPTLDFLSPPLFAPPPQSHSQNK